MLKTAIFLKQRQIELLIALDQTRHLGQAAEQLHMSQPAASKALVQLEQHVGHALFERGGGGTAPTEAGRFLIEHARNLSGAATRLSVDLEAMLNKGLRRLRLGILPSPAIHIVPRLIDLLLEKDPALELSMQEGLLHELLPRLSSHDLDCVIGRTNSRMDKNEIDSIFLYEDPIAVAVGGGNRLVRGDETGIEDLLALPWILPVQGSVLRERIDEMFYRLTVPAPGRCIESNAVLANIILVNRHDWVIALPTVTARFFEELGHLRILPIDTRSQIGNVEVLIRKSDVISPPLRLALRALQEMFPHRQGRNAFDT